MTVKIASCSRCLASFRLDTTVRFCPRCGLAIELASDDTPPLQLRAGELTIIVQDRLASGDVSNLYRCAISGLRRTGVLKIARTAAANHYLQSESEVLAQMHQIDAAKRFTAFLPRVLGSITYSSDGQPAQHANVIAYHDGINMPDELYSLREVRDAYPDGLDARDMAWIWRRLLTVLGFVHDQQVVHTAVSPDHVLIEPQGHKLVLIGWCGAVRAGQAPILAPARWSDWFSPTAPSSPQSDLAAASRTMMYLLGSTAEPAIARHLERAAESSCGAWKLLHDFDRMIETLWGPRRFRTFTIPSRGSSGKG